MKTFPCAALLCFLACAFARADLTIVQNIEGGGPVSSMTMKIKGDKARIEATPQMSTIVDSKTGDMITLMHDQKKFMRISADQAKAAAEIAMDGMDKNAAKPQLKPSGKKETINGIETAEYTIESPAFKGSYWIATNYPNAAAILKELSATTPQSWGVATRGMPDYRDFPGVPIRTNLTVGGAQIVTTVASIKQDPIPESEFATPAGYEEFQMPGIDTMRKKGTPTPPPVES